jgi:hypothetical protein
MFGAVPWIPLTIRTGAELVKVVPQWRPGGFLLKVTGPVLGLLTQRLFFAQFSNLKPLDVNSLSISFIF